MSLTIQKDIPGMPDNYDVTLTFKDGTVKKLTVVKHQPVMNMSAEMVPAKDAAGNPVQQITKWTQVPSGEMEFLTVENRWIVFQRADIREFEYSENFSIMLDLQKKRNALMQEKSKAGSSN